MTAIGQVGLSVLSMAGRSPTGQDADYLEWHLLDHLPEQYQLDGLRYGQRWASTSACRAARAAASERFAPATHVTQYLMGDPADGVVDRFLDLGGRLAAAGRYSVRLPSVLLGGFEPAGARAAARVSVSPEVVPFRPNTGLYLVLAEPPGVGSAAEYAAWLTDEHLPALVQLDGVAGAWWFTPAAVRPDRLDAGGYWMTALYLDGAPADVAGALADALPVAWERWQVTPALAAPFVAVRPWAWPEVG
jgi:hypothetical protein